MMADEDRNMAVKALDDRTQKYLGFLSQAVGGYRGLCEMMDAQLNRRDAEIERLEAQNAALLRALDVVMPWASKAVADKEDSVIGKRALDVALEAIANAKETT